MGKLTLNDCFYAYSLVATTFNEFKVEDGALVNSKNEGGGYDYVSLASKKKYKVGAKAHTVCSFDAYGAPLITVANGVKTDEHGRVRYGDHYEVVAYENGCNVWYITDAPAGSERPYKVENCLRLRFPIESGSRITLDTQVLEKSLVVDVNGVSFTLPAPNLESEFYIGFTACEGINRFYEIAVDE